MRLATLILLFLALPLAAQTGPAVSELAHYDAFMQGLLQDHGIHGAALAVTKDERLVYARGFGLADVEANEPVEPDAVFRIASVSKPITAVLVMRFVEQGVLALDAPAFALLPDLQAPDGQTEDARLGDITVRHLLQHSGGWDRAFTPEPLSNPFVIADAMGVPSPPSCETIIRYMRGQPLDFTPGARYSYFGFGYCVLEAIIERMTGEDYETYARAVLGEADIAGMQIGGELLEDRLPNEVRYYHQPEGATAPSVFNRAQQVPLPYGSFDLQARAASGGWVASAVDLVRFLAAVDGRSTRPDLLEGSTRQVMLSRPSLPDWNGSAWWYGLGWLHNTESTQWHNGSLPGTRSLIVRAEYEGLAWAAVINTTPGDPNSFIDDLRSGLWTQAQATTTWPTHDLFDLFPTTSDDAPEDARLALDVSPNPVRAHATVALMLEAPGNTRVVAYDALGREVTVLHEGALASGNHLLPLDASALPAGTYILRASTPAGTASRSMTILR